MSNYYENGRVVLTHSQRRRLRRDFDLSAFNKREILNMVAEVDSEDGLSRFSDHKNKKVQRALRRRMSELAPPVHVEELIMTSEGAEEAIPHSASVSNPSEFDELVAKFRSQGSANPERSARASMAARAGAAKRRAHSAAE